MANVDQRRALVDKVVAGFGDGLLERHFALCGVVFKPGTDDMREAPNRASMHELMRRAAGRRYGCATRWSRRGPVRRARASLMFPRGPGQRAHQTNEAAKVLPVFDATGESGISLDIGAVVAGPEVRYQVFVAATTSGASWISSRVTGAGWLRRKGSGSRRAFSTSRLAGGACLSLGALGRQQADGCARSSSAPDRAAIRGFPVPAGAPPPGGCAPE